MRPVIIGVVGGIGSGKGTVAEFLVEKGFEYYSLSDALRRKAESFGLSDNRENLINIGNSLRQERGNAVLAQEAVNWIKGSPIGRFVVDSIRHPEELALLKDQLNMFAIGVEVSSNEIRYGRVRNRNRPGDPTSLEEFLELVRREEEGTDGNSPHVRECLENVDVVFRNNDTKEKLLMDVESELMSRGLIEGGIRGERER